MPIAEKKLIGRLRRRVGEPGAVVARGIGDDCAVLHLPAGHEALVTTDLSLEGVHFRREWHPPESVGHRCLARGLSDIAAMGGEPLAAFLSLALPAKLPQKWVDRFLDGFLRLGRECKVPLAGGDTAASPNGVLCDIIVLGSTPKGGAILRSGARPGDGIYVSGALGGSAAVLAAMRAGRKLRPRAYPAHFFPVPRLAVGRELREKALASGMIDLSDGLSTDLAHICDESGVGAVVYGDRLPYNRAHTALDFALHGGEDYELLFTSAKRVPEQIAEVAITRIGEIVRGRGMTLVDGNGRRQPLRPQGWEHFARRK